MILGGNFFYRAERIGGHEKLKPHEMSEDERNKVFKEWSNGKFLPAEITDEFKIDQISKMNEKSIIIFILIYFNADFC